MIGRILAAAVTLALFVVLVLASWPQLFGLERVLGVAQLVSLRGLAVLVATLVAALVLLIALLTPKGRRFFTAVGVVLLAFAVLSVGVLAVRGADASALPEKSDHDLVVLAWNTLGDEPGADTIAQLALEQNADVVALPETSRDAANAIAALLSASDHPMQVLGVSFDEISKARSTMVLISDALGEYVVDDSVGNTVTLPSVVAVPADGDGPTIIAAHPVAPIPAEMDGWRAGLDWLAERCADADANVIVAGDLNSTLDHWASLGSDVGIGACRDAARAVGAGAFATWPTRMPSLLGAPIDHVLATGSWTPLGFRVIETHDDAGSDHRPIVAVLRAADD